MIAVKLSKQLHTLTIKQCASTRKVLMPQAQAPQVPTTLNGNDLIDIKYKVQKGTGIKFATVSNWKHMLMQPIENAVVTTVTTSNGFVYEVIADTQVEAYDPEAQARRKEARKNLQAEKAEVEKLFYADSIDTAEYNKRNASLAEQLKALK